MINHNDDPCYKPGALWKTRTSIKACQYKNLKNKEMVTVPKDEVIFLLGYIIQPDYQERIQFLWKQKILYANNIDVGHYFLIDKKDIEKKSKW